MRIAQVSPLFEAVPPKQYGGTERIVSYLTEELVRMGHEVTLFASGDSVTTARLVPARRSALRLDPSCQNWLPHHLLMLEQVLARADEFDVIHFHVDLFHLPSTRRCAVPSLTTMHGRLDYPDLLPFYREFEDAPTVSISSSQRAPLPFLNWVGTVFHGLPSDLYRLAHLRTSAPYLVFLGRVSPEKGPELAIRIAQRAGVALKIAAKVDATEAEYFEQVLRPLMDHPLIEFIGEVNDREKQELLSGALALLFPIDWPEPFGVVMIEAMACGTPVIARKRGSVPEIIEDGVTGFTFETAEEAVVAVWEAMKFDRRACRRAFERRFTASRMAADYLRVYESLLDGAPSSRRGYDATLADAVHVRSPPLNPSM